MMKIIHSIWQLFLCALSFQGCTLHDEVAGGSDHPNELVGRATPRTPTLASNIQINLYQRAPQTPALKKSSATTIRPILYRTDTCNSLGDFSFTKIPAGSYYVEALTLDSSQVALSSSIVMPTQGNYNTGLIELTPSAHLRLQFNPTGLVNFSDTLVLKGTHYIATQKEAGIWEYPWIPAGTYQIAPSNALDTSLRTVQSQAKSDTSLILDSTRIIPCTIPPTCPERSTLEILQTDTQSCILQWRCRVDSTSFAQVDSTSLRTASIAYSLDSSNKQDTIRLDSGKTMEISLTENGSTGYVWTLSGWDGNPVVLSTWVENPTDTVIAGVPGIRKMRIQVLAPLSQTITWKLIRGADTANATGIFQIHLMRETP